MSKLKELIKKLLVFGIKKSLIKNDMVRGFEVIKHFDIKSQYTNSIIDNEFIKMKVKALHTFQYNLTLLPTFCTSIIDIGDSNGTHIEMYKDNWYSKTKIDSLSINCDEKAVLKIKNKGLDAKCVDANEFCKHYTFPKKVDVVWMFEVLEHLENPVEILRNIKKISDRIILTVPYLKKSRIGLHHLRGKNAGTSKEDVHIFELSADDWRLVFKHAGWKLKHEEVYYQYPKNSVLSVLKYVWRYFDYEGFYGVILEK